MKVKVLQEFRDKNNFSILYKVGQVQYFDDERAESLIKRGLAEEIKDESPRNKRISLNDDK